MLPFRNRIALALPALALLAGWAGAATRAEIMNSALGQGINMGNYLDCPTEGQWHNNAKIVQEDFTRIKAQGYQSVRIPVRWSEHPTASAAPDYTIDAAFMARVKQVVTWAIDADLKVLLNVHHYTKTYNGGKGDNNWDLDGVYEPSYKSDPAAHRARLHAIWKQIVANFGAISKDDIVFEMLNEPEVENAALWNAEVSAWITLMRTTLQVTEHTLMVNAKGWNAATDLIDLEIPDSETNIIASFHYYTPFPFTHQGAGAWQAGAPDAFSTHWTGTPGQLFTLNEDFGIVDNWSTEQSVPVNVGEFGAIQFAFAADRKTWTQAVVSTSRKMGFSTHYWEYSEAFGVYDLVSGKWNNGMVAATQGNYAENRQLLWNPNVTDLNTHWYTFDEGGVTALVPAQGADVWTTNAKTNGYLDGSATLGTSVADGDIAAFALGGLQSAYGTPTSLQTSSYQGLCLTYRLDNAARLMLNDSVQEKQAPPNNNYGTTLPATANQWTTLYLDWDDLAQDKNGSTLAYGSAFAFDLSHVNDVRIAVQKSIAGGTLPYTVNLDVGEVGLGRSCGIVGVGWEKYGATTSVLRNPALVPDWSALVQSGTGKAELRDMQGKILWQGHLPTTASVIRALVASHGHRAVLQIGNQSWIVNRN